eukprot:3484147-Prymnesium_polylepis.1
MSRALSLGTRRLELLSANPTCRTELAPSEAIWRQETCCRRGRWHGRQRRKYHEVGLAAEGPRAYQLDERPIHGRT